MKTIVYYLIVSQLFFAPFCHAQNTTNQQKRHKIGFIAGYGGQEGIVVDYHYNVYFLQAQYSYTFWRKKHWQMEIVGQPQYNLTHYRPINIASKEVDGHEVGSNNDHGVGLRSGYEVGLNIGCMIKRNIFKDYISIYFLPSIGPHYVDGAPERQSSGFIFSDNLFIGLQIKIANGLHLDIRQGFRHISNANLKKPNGGVNTVVWSGGFFFTIP